MVAELVSAPPQISSILPFFASTLSLPGPAQTCVPPVGLSTIFIESSWLVRKRPRAANVRRETAV